MQERFDSSHPFFQARSRHSSDFSGVTFDPKTKLFDVENFFLNEGWLDRIEREAAGILESSRGPKRPFDLGQFKVSVLSMGELLGKKPGTREWYAAETIVLIGGIRSWLKAKQFDRPWDGLSAAVRLGILISEGALSLSYAGPLSTGLKQSESLQLSRAESARLRKLATAEMHASWCGEARLVWERNPSLSIKACAKAVITKLGKASKSARSKRMLPAERTVRRAISKVCPSKAGPGK